MDDARGLLLFRIINWVFFSGVRGRDHHAVPLYVLGFSGEGATQKTFITVSYCFSRLFEHVFATTCLKYVHKSAFYRISRYNTAFPIVEDAAKCDIQTLGQYCCVKKNHPQTDQWKFRRYSMK